MTTATDTLSSLHRGEIAATETYQQALEKVGHAKAEPLLRRIHEDHREAANLLRQNVRGSGGRPDTGSGAWGAFAKAVEGTAKLFGNTAALKALKEGEEHGIKQYEDALQDSSVPGESRSLIQSTLLPRARQHVSTLDQLMRSDV